MIGGKERMWEVKGSWENQACFSVDIVQKTFDLF